MPPDQLEKIISQYQQAALAKASNEQAKQLVERNVAALRNLAKENNPEQIAVKTYGLLSSPDGNVGDSPLGVAACQIVLGSGTDGPKIATEVGSQLVSHRL